jgi:hypothetical protein
MNNYYKSDQKAIARLVEEYLKYKSLIIGFDFDCTIYDYHSEGLELDPVILLLRRASDANLIMCLHTLSLKEQDIIKKVEHTKSLGINVHFINESPVLNNSFPENKKKPFYSILLDDRAGLSSAFTILEETLNILGL